MGSTVIAVAIRLAISASLAVSGVIHAYLYVHGYRDIPTIGPAFLGQAIVFCVLALLILVGVHLLRADVRLRPHRFT